MEDEKEIQESVVKTKTNNSKNVDAEELASGMPEGGTELGSAINQEAVDNALAWDEIHRITKQTPEEAAKVDAESMGMTVEGLEKYKADKLEEIKLEKIQLSKEAEILIATDYKKTSEEKSDGSAKVDTLLAGLMGMTTEQAAKRKEVRLKKESEIDAEIKKILRKADRDEAKEKKEQDKLENEEKNEEIAEDEDLVVRIEDGKYQHIPSKLELEYIARKEDDERRQNIAARRWKIIDDKRAEEQRRIDRDQYVEAGKISYQNNVERVKRLSKERETENRAKLGLPADASEAQYNRAFSRSAALGLIKYTTSMALHLRNPLRIFTDYHFDKATDGEKYNRKESDKAMAEHKENIPYGKNDDLYYWR